MLHSNYVFLIVPLLIATCFWRSVAFQHWCH